MAAPLPPCDDLATVTAETARYTWSTPAAVPRIPPPCYGPRQRCQMSSSKNQNHRASNGAGAIVPRYKMCLSCQTHAGAMVSNNRRPRFSPANTPFNIAGKPLNGVLGAHTKGRLCDRCVTNEIEAYWNRRYASGRQKTEAQAKSTCKCEKQLRKRMCYRDRDDVQSRIQLNSDLHAGPQGWLSHLDFDEDRNRAIITNHNGALLLRRRTEGKQDNACRCGRDIERKPAAQHLQVQVPVGLCTACSGVVVMTDHPRVRNWNFKKTMGEDEANMDLGRAVPL